MEITPGEEEPGAYKVTRTRYTHYNAKDFHRLVLQINNIESTDDVLLVQYRCDNKPREVQNKPHGSNKKDVFPFIPTKKSVLERLCEELKVQPSNKRAMANVEKEAGGLFDTS